MRAELLRVGYLQTVPRFGEREANLRRAGELLAELPDCHLVVLPELFSSGYLFRDRAEAERFAEPPDGPTLHFLRDRARELGAWITAGFAERDGDRIFNSATLVGPGGEEWTYRKVHLFDRETLVFDRGDGPLAAHDLETSVGTVRVGLLVCFDWIFPEAARTLAVDGAEILLHPSNLVRDPCQQAMRTRCLENRVFAVTANRAGADDRGELRLSFTGRSQIVSPSGELIVRSAAAGEAAEVREIDLRLARDKRFTERNELMADRRPELYGPLGSGAHPAKE